MKTPHIPVLQDEIVEAFSRVDGVVLDCTVGYGGHSELLLESNPNLKMICNDQDDEALEFSKKRLEKYKDRVTFIKGRFSQALSSIDNKDELRGILADIGVSSLQLDKSNRGFRFDSDILDMRMDQNQQLTASEVINTYSLSELERIFKEYGEIREYKKYASKIIERRKETKFKSSLELSEYIASFGFRGNIHPATLVFQAIRIEVNSELDELKLLLENIRKAKLTNTTIAIISFHSLEDRIVKQAFKDYSKKCICNSEVFRCECGNNNSMGKIITKKPILPTDDEIEMNIRSRSSKLRIFQNQ